MEEQIAPAPTPQDMVPDAAPFPPAPPPQAAIAHADAQEAPAMSSVDPNAPVTDPNAAPTDADVLPPDEAAQLAADEERGYEEFTWHGRKMYRILYSPDRTFYNEQDAMDWVAGMRGQAHIAARLGMPQP